MMCTYDVHKFFFFCMWASNVEWTPPAGERWYQSSHSAESYVVPKHCLPYGSQRMSRRTTYSSPSGLWSLSF